MINRQKHKSTDFKNRSVVYNKCLTNLVIISFLFLFLTTKKKRSTGKNWGYIRFFRSPRDVITHTLRDRFHCTGTMLICGRSPHYLVHTVRWPILHIVDKLKLVDVGDSNRRRLRFSSLQCAMRRIATNFPNLTHMYYGTSFAPRWAGKLYRNSLKIGLRIVIG